eukprot:12089674-Karenia_brevis.AAC.1
MPLEWPTSLEQPQNFKFKRCGSGSSTWLSNTKRWVLKQWRHPTSYKQLCKGWGRRSMPWGSCHRA